MVSSQIRCLLLINCLFVLMGCVPAYKQMRIATGNVEDLQKLKPDFSVALYSTTVDVVGNHLSGILLIKKMPDSSIRMVFSNEIGFKFFDFGFMPNGDFKVYSVIKQMNKKPVLTTLRKDFEMILMERFEKANPLFRINNGLLYYIFPQKKGYNYYITDSTSDKLVRIERTSNRKTIVEAIMKNFSNGIPDTIGISHKTFSFDIALKKLER